MAISNRDRVGKMFELLAPPLDEFISRSVASRLNKGASWTVLVQLKDEQKGVDGEGVPPRSIRRCSCGCSPRTSRTT